MQAWLCENPTGVEALQWKELPTPEPKAGEVRIAIRAASLNFPDLLIVQNKYQMKPPLPFVPGSEYAGTVEAVGETLDRYVLALGRSGVAVRRLELPVNPLVGGGMAAGLSTKNCHAALAASS